MTNLEAFVLLTLPSATLSFHGASQTGTLALECVTLPVPHASTPVQRDVYLVLRLGTIETPIDPTRVVQRTDGAGCRTYTFAGTEADPAEMVVSVSLPAPGENNPYFAEDLETFETILAQYTELRVSPDSAYATHAGAVPSPKSGAGPGAVPGDSADLRGHLVVIDQADGEVLGQFDDTQFKVREDPALYERGHENDAVVIEVPDTRPGHEQDATALQMFVRAVPPEEQDWITKSATIVSHAISTTTNLLLTTITTASNYYINHSRSSSQSSNHPPSTSIPTPPSRAVVFLTSERTRRGLAGVHAVSGQAVKVSSKTVSTIDNMIRRAMGSGPKQPRQFLPQPSGSSPSSGSGMLAPNGHGTAPPPPLPPRTPSPASHLAPPPAYPGPPPPLPPPATQAGFPGDKPPLPPRRSSSPQPTPPPPPLPPRKPLSKKARVLLSADLILSTIDHETRRLLDAGTQTVGAVVGHKYGPDAKETSLLMAGTARNIGLVYVDMRGIGRRALLRRAGAQFVKGRLQ
ncbi:putative senescence-associated protein [Lyophyllum shimeji]|uniref:Senescence-associated protein n=1 Tax=Lyophyllum shimeji TaxID=47721 RepID=A0A9P3PGH3_LYOSH|nr:putative senescence-associated protein [Lyophyllum shimeji]